MAEWQVTQDRAKMRALGELPDPINAAS